jgi:DNA-binding SARP family transcriptional activator/O-methyltransferase involved in polyketide biosynthesis
MQVRVLGPVEVRGDDGGVTAIGQRKTRELLFVLVLAGGPVPSEELQSMLWVAADTHNMLSALTSTVNRLRKLLPKGCLVRDDAGYRVDLDPERDYLDIREFRDLVAAARKVRETDPGRAADLYQKAMDLWRDPRMPDLPDTPAVTRRVDRLRAERRDAIEALVEVRMGRGRHADVAVDLPGFLAEDPLNERLWLALLLALYRDGRKDAALQAYEEARTSFLTEVGAEPSLPLQGMRDRIVADAPGLAWSPEQTVQENRAIIAGADVTVVSAARAYDYLLGGEDNFEVDRQSVARVLAVASDARESAHDNRRFLRRAVRLLAERGIRQFIDIGAGLPTYGSVHEVAREVDSEARVVYVDQDPMVAAHGRALIDDSRNTTYIVGDLLQPTEILSSPQARRLIDPAEPTAVLMFYVLHFIPADAAHEVLETYRSWMAPGSALAISHVTRDGSDPRVLKAIEGEGKRSSIRTFLRSRAEIEALFSGLELVAPLDAAANWLATERTLGRKIRDLASIGIVTG